jgi:hypothetical protein
MATVEGRYEVATAYVTQAIHRVESAPALVNVVDRYAARLKTASVREALTQIQGRWLRAVSDADRATVAREAELLADRTKENLPGAPEGWTRTNLFAGEREATTPATSYGQSLSAEAEQDWHWLSDRAVDAADATKSFARWLLAGGGLLVVWKTLDYFGKRQTVSAIALNRGLERAAAEAEEQ